MESPDTVTVADVRRVADALGVPASALLALAEHALLADLGAPKELGTSEPESVREGLQLLHPR